MNKEQLIKAIDNIHSELKATYECIDKFPKQLEELYEKAAELEASLEELEDDLLEYIELHT